MKRFNKLTSLVTKVNQVKY